MTYLKRHLGRQVELFRQSNIMEQTSTVPRLFINHIVREGSLDDPQAKVEDPIRVIELFRVEVGFSEFRHCICELCRWGRQIGGRV